MDYDHKAIVEKIERACRREMKRIERDYDDLINSYTDIQSTNGEDACILGEYGVYKDVLATIEGMKAKEDREANRIERRKVRVFGQGKV